MTSEQLSLKQRILQSAKGHMKVAGIAVIFGMAAYGGVHILVWVINSLKNM